MTRAHVLMIIDRSGSMMFIKADAEGGIADFLNRQRELVDQNGEMVDVTISLAHFNHEFAWVLQGSSIGMADGYELWPDGTTALLDAVGRAVREDEARIGVLANDAKPDRIACVIVTDGQENASREWTADGVRKLIETQKSDHGWEFVFLAADITTIKLGDHLGANTTLYNATGAGTRSAYNITGRSVGSYLSGVTSNIETPDTIDER